MRAVSPAEPCRRRAERGEVTRELSVVERIEEFGAELDRPALRAVKGDTSEVLEKGEVPLIASRAPDHVPPRVAKAGGPVHADVGHPGKSRNIEVRLGCLGAGVGVPEQVSPNTITCTRRITGEPNGKGSPRLEGADAGNLPSSQAMLQHARRPLEERKVVNVVEDQHVPAIEVRIAAVRPKIVSVHDGGEIARSAHVNRVRPSVGGLERKPVVVVYPEVHLKRVIVRRS